MKRHVHQKLAVFNRHSQLFLLALLLFGIFLLPHFFRAEVLAQQESEGVAEEVTEEEPEFPKLSKEELAGFQYVATVRLSGRIVFSAKAAGLERILLADLDLKQVLPLIQGPGNNSYPVWSPDGKSFVFQSDRKGNWDLFLSSWDGKSVRTLTDSPQDEVDPSWFPDGQRIVFSRASKNGRQHNIWSLDIGNGEEAQLTEMRGKNITAQVSPNGRDLAFTTNRHWPGWDVCFMPIGSKVENCPLQGKESFCRPRWTEGGKSVMYLTGSGDQVDIGQLNLSTRETRRLSRAQYREYNPWLDEARKILFYTSETGGSGNFDIVYALNPNDPPSPIVRSEFSVRYMSWTPVTTVQLAAEEYKQGLQ